MRGLTTSSASQAGSEEPRARSVAGIREGLTLALAVIGLIAAPALASAAGFVPAGPAGVQMGFLESDVLPLGLPTATVNGGPFYTAGGAGGFLPGPFDIELSQDICFLAASSPTVCQADLTGIGEAFSALVTWTVLSQPVELDGEDYTLFLSSLISPTESAGSGYLSSEVDVRTDATPIPGLDTSGVSGSFDSFNNFGVVRDETFLEGFGITDLFLGWRVSGENDTVTFRYDVSGPPNGRDSPIFGVNAEPVVVPEPGTVVLMVLGLAGLSIVGNREARL